MKEEEHPSPCSSTDMLGSAGAAGRVLSWALLGRASPEQGQRVLHRALLPSDTWTVLEAARGHRQSCGWVTKSANLGQSGWWRMAAALGLCFPTSPAFTDGPEDGK